MYTFAEKKYMLALARRSIANVFDRNEKLVVSDNELPSSKLKEILSCFVTLTIGGTLRGCIGHISAFQPLYLDIIDNAAAAAFEDYRFTPLTSEEFDTAQIEISVLSEPVPLMFSSPEELLHKIKPGTDGIILERGGYSATFLPQVWDDFTAKEEFLSALSQKAGLDAGDWKLPGTTVKTYRVEAFS